MIAARDHHATVLLAGGEVLVAGGISGSSILSSAEIYTHELSQIRTAFLHAAVLSRPVWSISGDSGHGGNRASWFFAKRFREKICTVISKRR
jgi:hypothetical protein